MAGFRQIRLRVFDLKAADIDAALTELEFENLKHLLQLELDFGTHMHREFLFFEFVLATRIFEIESLRKFAIGLIDGVG